MIPMKMATAMEITTQTEAILLEIVSSFSLRMPMKRSRICGIPKYPRPQAMVEATLSRL